MNLTVVYAIPRMAVALIDYSHVLAQYTVRFCTDDVAALPKKVVLSTALVVDCKLQHTSPPNEDVAVILEKARTG
jgi:hypothetical protein